MILSMASLDPPYLPNFSKDMEKKNKISLQHFVVVYTKI